MGMLTHLVNMEMPSGSAAPFVQWKTVWTGEVHKSIIEDEEVIDLVLVSSEVAEWVGRNQIEKGKLKKAYQKMHIVALLKSG